MKSNLFFSLLFLFLFQQLSFAQEATAHNPLVLGGSFNFSAQKNGVRPFFPLTNGAVIYTSADAYTYNYFEFSPYVGKSFGSHFLIGAGLEFNTTKFVQNISDFGSTYDYKNTAKGYGFELFCRYNFIPQKAFQFFVQPSIGYSFATQKYYRNEVINANTSNVYFVLSAAPGFLYEISNRWRLTLSVGSINYIDGFEINKLTNEKTNSSFFNVNTSLRSARLGIEVKL